jgi:hypothetical protein
MVRKALWGALLMLVSQAIWSMPETYLQKRVVRYSLQDPAVPKAVLREASSRPWTAADKGPVSNLYAMARESSGAVWLGSNQGAARFAPDERDPWERWHYFSGTRWLADDEVLNIYVQQEEPERKIWLRSKTGVSLITWTPMTLAEKAAYYDDMIEKRHLRHGFVTGSHLRDPQDFSTNVNSDDDNDGLWTAMYMAAQSYCYAATKSEDARRKAQRSLKAMLRLEEITTIPGFYARSFKSMDEPAPRGGEWHPTADGKWLWKGDTSSDESVGHYYGYALYYDLVADDAEKEAIRRVITRMTDHLLQHDYKLVDLDGKATRWGNWDDAFYTTPEGEYEKALRSMELLSFLKTSYHITGNEKYQKAYWERIQRGYATYTLYYRRWISAEQEINFSDDELYYLSVLPLLLYEKDPALRDNYLPGVRFTWQQIRPDYNPLWNFMTVASGAETLNDRILHESVRTLQRIPWDMRSWAVRNSHRIDVSFEQGVERHGNKFLKAVVAPDERRMHKWNGNPYVADERGNGSHEEAPTFFLLPYWMGRYYGWIKE